MVEWKEEEGVVECSIVALRVSHAQCDLEEGIDYEWFTDTATH